MRMFAITDLNKFGQEAEYQFLDFETMEFEEPLSESCLLPTQSMAKYMIRDSNWKNAGIVEVIIYTYKSDGDDSEMEYSVNLLT
jgi:hypothetical protein